MTSNKNTTIKNRPEIGLVEVRGNFNVYLEWDKAIGADKYSVTRSDDREGPYSKVAVLSFDNLSFTDKTIEREGLYWYKIIAYKNVGKSKPIKKAGTPISANITTMLPPVLKKISNDKNKSITLSWQDNENVTAYNVLRRFDFMKKPLKIATVDKAQKTYTDDDFVNGQLFYYSIQSVTEEESDIRYSNPSNEMCSVCLDKVKVLEVKRKHGKKVFLSLRLTAGADGYILFKSDSKDGEYTEVSRTDSISSLVCSDKGEKGEKGAYYKAACIKKCGDNEFVGPKSDSIFVKYKI